MHLNVRVYDTNSMQRSLLICLIVGAIAVPTCAQPASPHHGFLGGPWAVTIMGASCFLLAVGMSFAVPDLWKSSLLPVDEKGE